MRRRAFWSAGFIAAGVVTVHYFAHKNIYKFTTLPALQIMYVGIAVFLTTFALVYINKVGWRGLFR